MKIRKENEQIGEPFNNAEEAWFWFIKAQQARNEGARIQAGLSLTQRPCEPADILKILDRLYRNRMVLRDHLLVLRYYGRLQMAPDPHRVKEARAATIWHEAISKLEPVLIRKGIIAQKKMLGKGSERIRKKLTTPYPNKYWASGAVVHSNISELNKQKVS